MRWNRRYSIISGALTLCLMVVVAMAAHFGVLPLGGRSGNEEQVAGVTISQQQAAPAAADTGGAGGATPPDNGQQPAPNGYPPAGRDTAGSDLPVCPTG